MLVVEEKLLEIEEPNIICSLNYPVIRLLNKENNFINYINKKYMKMYYVLRKL